MVRMTYPLETVGSFSSDDEVMDGIWDAGWRTLQLCAEDSYTDTPFRERGLYAGDMLPEVGITMAVNGDMRLADHSLSVFQDMYQGEMYGEEIGPYEEYPFMTLFAADWVQKYKKEKVDETFYENYKALVGTHLSRKAENGLVPTSSVFIEWTTIQKRKMINTAFQATLYQANIILAQWAKELDRADDEQMFLKNAEELSAAMIENLWDKEKKAFVDGIRDGEKINEYHITSTIWPLLYGITPEGSDEALQIILEEIKT